MSKSTPGFETRCYLERSGDYGQSFLDRPVTVKRPLILRGLFQTCPSEILPVILIPGSLGRESAGAVTSFPGHISNLPVCDFLCDLIPGSVKGSAGAVTLFPGRPVCDFLCDTVSGISPSEIFSVILIPGSVTGYRRSSHVVSGTNSSAIFSVTLFPGRNWGNMPVLTARHGKKRHITLRTTDPLVVLNWRPSEINV